MPRYTNEERKFEDVSSFSSKNEYNKSKKVKKGKHKGIKIFISVFCVFLLLIGGGIILASTYLFGNLSTNKITKDKTELGISSGTVSHVDITNIALFGLDSRSDDFSGRSDVMMVLTLDRINNKVKLTSILRDSYVNVGFKDDVSLDKMCHAYAYGGAEQAIRTINQNFDLDIKDYVTVNFSKMASIVDAFNGIELKVTNEEVAEINKNLSEIINKELGATESDYLDSDLSGTIHLNGAQAVAFSRIRYVGGDDARAERQQKVLSALMEKMTSLSALEYPSVINQMSALCETSLDISTILGFVPFASGGFKIEKLVIPGEAENPQPDYTQDGMWIWNYDIQAGADHINSFIYENKAN